MQLASSKIHHSDPLYSRVYMYRLLPDGTSAAVAYNGKTPDSDRSNAASGDLVRALRNGVNCCISQVHSDDPVPVNSHTTGSELIVLIRRHDEIIGAIDIESDLPDAFSDVEQQAVVEVADALAALL
ncbi:MAG: hypothetical protein JSW51_06290 [Gemmatimonadota bacterium]|nr:MAG: hypothetical protein JSW51_06290 [Gemmatimonadota bacterium]